MKLDHVRHLVESGLGQIEAAHRLFLLSGLMTSKLFEMFALEEYQRQYH